MTLGKHTNIGELQNSSDMKVLIVLSALGCCFTEETKLVTAASPSRNNKLNVCTGDHSFDSSMQQHYAEALSVNFLTSRYNLPFEYILE